MSGKNDDEENFEDNIISLNSKDSKDRSLSTSSRTWRSLSFRGILPGRKNKSKNGSLHSPSTESLGSKDRDSYGFPENEIKSPLPPIFEEKEALEKTIASLESDNAGLKEEVVKLKEEIEQLKATIKAKEEDEARKEAEIKEKSKQLWIKEYLSKNANATMGALTALNVITLIVKLAKNGKK